MTTETLPGCATGPAGSGPRFIVRPGRPRLVGEHLPCRLRDRLGVLRLADALAQQGAQHPAAVAPRVEVGVPVPAGRLEAGHLADLQPLLARADDDLGLDLEAVALEPEFRESRAAEPAVAVAEVGEPAVVQDVD